MENASYLFCSWFHQVHKSSQAKPAYNTNGDFNDSWLHGSKNSVGKRLPPVAAQTMYIYILAHNVFGVSSFCLWGSHVYVFIVMCQVSKFSSLRCIIRKITGIMELPAKLLSSPTFQSLWRRNENTYWIDTFFRDFWTASSGLQPLLQ